MVAMVTNWGWDNEWLWQSEHMVNVLIGWMDKSYQTYHSGFLKPGEKKDMYQTKFIYLLVV